VRPLVCHKFIIKAKALGQLRKCGLVLWRHVILDDPELDTTEFKTAAGRYMIA
jgi:hypothetical protein